jgi:hypothetical protein
LAIGLRSTGTFSFDVNAASANLIAPAGAVAGDVMILSVGLNPTACATPAGWTAVGSITLAGASTFVFRRTFVAGDTTWTLTPGGGAQQFGGTIVTFTGVDNVTPIDATGTANSSASGTTITTNLVTVVTDQAWHLIGVGAANAGTYSATGFTVFQNGATPANEVGGLLYNQTPKSTGSTGTVVVTTGSGGKSAVPFALRPAASSTVVDEDEGLRYTPIIGWW